ncbi:MAG: prepilin-type N-terminal cleavage/methylation domain-containing protein [Candidatus Falkowbacteria bacterium]
MHKKGFTLIELLVVVAIIGLLATLSMVALNNARARSRDAKRVADVKQMQTALELYFNDQGTYPSAVPTSGTTIASGTVVYMNKVPVPPLPVDGTSCPANPTAYTYGQTDSGRSYTIAYCLGNTTGGIAGNVVSTATPAGIK